MRTSFVILRAGKVLGMMAALVGIEELSESETGGFGILIQQGDLDNLIQDGDFKIICDDQVMICFINSCTGVARFQSKIILILNINLTRCLLFFLV